MITEHLIFLKSYLKCFYILFLCLECPSLPVSEGPLPFIPDDLVVCPSSAKIPSAPSTSSLSCFPAYLHYGFLFINLSSREEVMIL